MEPSRGDSRYNLNYSMSSIGLTLTDQADMYGNPTVLSGRPPSSGILQGIGVGGVSSSLLSRSSGNLIPNAQCQAVGNNNQQRGLKRAGSDCYDDSHQRVGTGGITTIQGLDNCNSSSNVQHGNQQQPQTSGTAVQDIPDDSYNLHSKKSPPANGKKTKGRVKIKMEYIDNKLRRYTTFSKRKTGIMKKAYELSTLTGTQVMLLVASETGHVYTFATRKLQPMITSEAGKQLIQTCLNSPDPPSIGTGDQRMSATGFEETELSYNIADEDSKDARSPISSVNDSEESSDIEGIGNDNNADCLNMENSLRTNTNEADFNDCGTVVTDKSDNRRDKANVSSLNKSENRSLEIEHHSSDLKNVPQKVLLKLIESGHLKVHNEEDGSGHQYVAIPISSACIDRSEKTSSGRSSQLSNNNLSELIIKEKH